MSQQASQPSQQQTPYESLMHALAGSLAGAYATILLYPLENLKTRMQIAVKRQVKAENDEETQLQQNQEKKNLSSLIKEVYTKEGTQGFYKGMTPLLIGNIVSYGVYFFWYELAKKHLKIQVGNILGYTKASLISGIFTSIATNPFWVVQSRMTLSQEKLSFLKTLTQMLKQEGFQSLFKGLTASLLLVINPIIQFLVYEYLKKKLNDKQIFKNSKFILHFISGAISKAIATFITYPYQVLRTFTHMDKDKNSLNYIQISQNIYQTSGIQGFFKGLTPKLMQTVLNSAFMLAVYEFIFEIVKTTIFSIFNHQIVNQQGSSSPSASSKK